MGRWWKSKLFQKEFNNSNLLHRQAQQWSRLGDEAPYWSVFSGCSKTVTIEAGDQQEFYRSGEDEIQLMRDYFRYAGRHLPSGICVDWGCGLGRVAIHLASLFQRVIGVDISKSHLSIARTYTANLDPQSNQRMVFYHLFEDEASLRGLIGQVDLVHSLLVLQHMPPPLMVETLAIFARLLKKGGYAFFQIPTYGEKYDYQKYNLEHGGEFDMHVLAQHEIHAVFREHGCRAIATLEKDRTGPEFLSHYFIFQKD